MVRRLILSLILVTSWIAAAAQGNAVSNELVKARYLVSEKKYNDALMILGGIQGKISDPWLDLTMGQALYGAGRISEARNCLEKVMGPCEPHAHFILAKISLNLNDVQGAIQYLSQHLASGNHYSQREILMDPEFSKLESNRDWVHLWQTEWYSESERQYAECQYLIGEGKWDEAEEILLNLISMNPDQALAWLLLAEIRKTNGQEKASRQAFEKASQLADSESVGFKEKLLDKAMEWGSYDEVRSLAGDLLRLDPTNPAYILARAFTRLMESGETVAQKEMQMMESIGIASHEIYYQAGKRMAGTNPLLSESYLSRAIDSGAFDDRFFFLRATVRVALEKYQGAMDDFAMSLDLNPDQPLLYLNRGRIRFESDDRDGACHDWQKAAGMGNKEATDLLYKHCRLR